MADPPPRLFLIDGCALAYRAHFAMARNPLINSRGENTSAVYLFLRTLRSLFDHEAPTHVAVVFDTPEPTFRHQKYEAYKATREKMPDDLVNQLPLIQELISALGIPRVEKPGFEADDIIGTLAVRAAKEGMDTFLVSRDKDFMQLLGPHIRMYDFKRGMAEAEVLGPEAALRRFGVGPDKVVDVLGLMGDSSDNVPGVPGVGEKTAVKLVTDHGSLEAALEAAEKGGIVGRAGKNLVAFKDQARLSKDLVTLDTDVDLDLGPGELIRGESDQATLRTLFMRLEFRDLLEAIDEGETGAQARHYHLVKTPDAFRALVETLRGAGRFVLDLETTSLNPREARIVGVSLSVKPHEAYYVPANLDPPVFQDRASGGGTTPGEAPGETGTLFSGDEELLDLAPVLEGLRPLLEDPALEKCGQNLKYDLLVLRHHGMEVRGVAFDTMVAAYLDDPGARQHGLDALALRFLQVKKIPIESLIGKGKKQITMDAVPVEAVTGYACEDADITFQLWEFFTERLRILGVETLNSEVEVPLIQVLMDMESRGIRLEPEKLRRLGEGLKTDLARLETDLHALAGEAFNVQSPKQLQPILYEKLKVHEAMGVKRIKRTKTGLSTDQSVLETLRPHPFVEKLLEYRVKSKLQNTYVDALPALVDPSDGRIHTSFNQTVTATGRLSSSNPNLQNIPIRTRIGSRIREAFLPAADGWKLLSADYSQVELRIMAHLSRDEALLEAFRAGEDIHRRTAALVFEVKPEDVTPELRSRAKAINFGIMYGMGSNRLARETGISDKEARAFIQAYFEGLPAVKAFLDGCIETAEKNGFVTTLLNRRRNLPEIQSGDPRIRAQARNIAVNTPIQGTAADLVKVAMVRVHQRLKRTGMQSNLLLQVHDELVFEAPESEVEALRALVVEEMEGAFSLDLPLKVDVGVGENWLQAHP